MRLRVSSSATLPMHALHALAFATVLAVGKNYLARIVR
jgi:hypothetical protein